MALAAEAPRNRWKDFLQRLAFDQPLEFNEGSRSQLTRAKLDKPELHETDPFVTQAMLESLVASKFWSLRALNQEAPNGELLPRSARLRSAKGWVLTYKGADG